MSSQLNEDVIKKLIEEGNKALLDKVNALQEEVHKIRSSRRESVEASDSAEQGNDDVKKEITEVADKINTTAVDELFRVVQGVNAATAHMLSSGAKILVELGDEVKLNKKPREGNADQTDLANTLNRLPPDLYKGYLHALEKAVKIPGDMAEKFTKTHREALKPIKT